MSPSIAQTRDFARAEHAGQVDQQGRDYFDAHLVPIAAALAPFGEAFEILGLLHDIVEDTDVTLDELREHGYDELIVTGVDSMTRRKREPYPSLILRSAAHPLGRRGKLVDNGWNILSNHGWSKVDPIRADSMLNGRYLPARKLLLAADTINGAELHAIEQTLRSHLDRLDAAAGMVAA